MNTIYISKIKSILKNIKYLLSVIFFIGINIFIFNPIVLSNKKLKQHDIEQWTYSAKESIDYRNNNQEEPLWSNSMFSGMPAYLINMNWSNDIIKIIHRVYGLFFPHPTNILFISMLSFYIMLLSFGVRNEIAVFGSIAFSLSSYMLVGIGAGHNSRIGAISYLPLIIAGVQICLHKNKNIGFIVTALALALQLRLNHLQITYYTLIILIFYGISQIIYFHKKKNLKFLFKRLSILVIAAIISVGTFFGEIWSILEYSNESIRGKSDLDIGRSGLDKQYAFQYSNGIFEPLTLFFPHILGGSSQEILDKKSSLGKALRKNNIANNQINNQLRRVPTYWGDQPLTAPYYVGAISIFLLIFGLLILKSHEKNWLLYLFIFSIILSMGNNLDFINNLFFDYLPGYNKFRSVTFIIIISIFSVVLISVLGIEKFISSPQKFKKELFQTVLITISIYSIIFLSSFALSFSGKVDANFINYPEWFLDSLVKDRKSLYFGDLLKGGFFIIVLILSFYGVIYKKIPKMVFGILIIILITIDHFTNNHNILKNDSLCELYNDCSFKKMKEFSINLTESDQYILENNNQRKRVYNLQNTFNEAKTSYFHSSIGGYHGAKMRRYQDIIENIITEERSVIVENLRDNNRNFSEASVINMLNVGFIKFGENRNNVIKNDFSNGNAWFVNKLYKVNSASEEMELLHNIDTKEEAIIDVSRFNLANGETEFNIDGRIELVEYSPKKLIYNTSNKFNGFIVFSEIFYPHGWKVFVNGIEKKIVRTNYILRGLEIEKGENKIEMIFEPESYSTGNFIIKTSNYILLILVITLIIIEVRNQKKI